VFFGRQVLAFHTKGNMECGSRDLFAWSWIEVLEPASESIIFLQNKRKCRPNDILLHSRRLYLQQFDCEDATSHTMFFSVLCHT